jgi:hypothetical protein
LQGTRSGADVEAILGGLRTAPEITSLSPSGASQGRLEYRGTFRGSAEDLATDVRSLAVDRFDVSVHDDPARGLILTLRKLRD